MTSLQGKNLLHYRILEEIGRGGMGIVYKARDTKLERTVAVKILPPEFITDERDRSRFLREAHTAANLNHPHICVIHDVAEDNNILFIVMEYIQGRTLGQLLSDGTDVHGKKPGMQPEQALSIAIQIADALAHAHEHDIVHRDLKPDNIMIGYDYRVKVMDFGLAKTMGSLKLTRPMKTLGTLGYMSPEQLQGEELDGRSDLFSLGVILYEMLTSRLPLEGDSEGTLIYAKLHREPEPLPEHISAAHPGLQSLLYRALEKDPKRRYTDAQEMLAELQRCSHRISAMPMGGISLKEMPVAKSRKRQRLPHPVKDDRSSQFYGSIRRFIRSPLFLIPGILLLLLPAIYLLLRTSKSPDTAAPTVARTSVAVLPFDNLSSEPDNEYFSDGITEDIITHLSKIGSLRVTSRTSVMQYKNSSKNIREIGRELGAETILEGSVRRIGDRIRVVGQLIDARTDEHIWAETYDRDVTDIFVLQSEIAHNIAQALKATLSPREERLLTQVPTENFDAYQLYLRGREYSYRYTYEDNETAIAYYNRALELDSSYALAYAGLADAYNQRHFKYFYPAEVIDSSIAFSMQALSINPDLAEAYKSLAQANDASANYTQSLAYYAKAMELNPNYWPAIIGYSQVNFTLGKLDEALIAAHKSVALAPNMLFGSLTIAWIYQRLECDSLALQWYERALNLEPENQYVLSLLSTHLMYMDDYERAKEYYTLALSINSQWYLGYFIAGQVELMAGNFGNALELYAAMVESSGANPEYYVGYVLRETGSVEEGNRILSDQIDLYVDYLATTPDEDNTNEFSLAGMYAATGETEKAFHWLRIAIDKGWTDYRRLDLEPYFDTYASDPEYISLVEEIRANVRGMRESIRLSHPGLVCGE